nr:CD15/CS22/SEF14 family fimbrial major subunit [Salmonella enterica]
MRKSASAVAVLALIACGSAHAAGFVGNKAEVQAAVTIAAQNTTSANWSQDPALQGLLLLLVRKLVLSALLLLVHITQYLLQVKGLRYLVV